MRKFGATPVFVLLAYVGCAGKAVAQLTAMPTAITFQSQQGAAVPPQILTIGGPNGVGITATASYGSNNPAQWFLLSETSLISGQSLTVSLATTNLTSGTTGSILFTELGSSYTITVPVTFMLEGTGNGVLTATPPFVTLNLTALTPQQQTISIAGPPSVSLSSSVNLGTGAVGWLTATQPQGSPPTAITLTVNPVNLPIGIISGSVTVTENGTSNFVTIPVSVTIGAGLYTSTPSPFTFSVNGDTPILTDQNLTINGPTNAEVGVTASVNNGGYEWLSVSPGSGTLTNGALTAVVTVNPVDLGPNQTFTGSVVVTQSGSTVLTVPVTVTTSRFSTLAFTPVQANFSWEIGTAAPPPQTIIVSNPGNQAITVAATQQNCSAFEPWLNASSSTANNATTITVSIITGILPATDIVCTGSIQVSAPAATNPTTTIPVSVLVSTNPVLTISPSSLEYSVQPPQGLQFTVDEIAGSPLPASPWIVAVASSSPGTQQLPFTFSVNPASFTPNFLSITQTSSSTPAALAVELNASVVGGLSVGTYVDNIVISSTGAGSPSITLPVTLTVGPGAALVSNPPQLALNYQIGQPPPASSILTVSSTDAPIAFTATPTSANCGNFLSVSPTATLNTLTAAGQNGTALTVAVGVAGLTIPTTCDGNALLTTTNSPAPSLIPVALNVVQGAAINIGANSVTQAATPGSTTAIMAPVPLSSTDGSTVIPFTIAVTTIPTGQSWLSIPGSSTGSTPSSAALQLNPAGLAAGTYEGVVTIIDNRANAPVPAQYLPVTFVVAPNITVTPSALAPFTVLLGGTSPSVPVQTFTVNGVPSTSTIGVSPSTSGCGSGWLTASLTGNTVTVGVATSSLVVSGTATCLGNVLITVPGAAPNPLYVPVTVNVSNATLSLLPTTPLAFTYVVGSGVTPPSQVEMLSSSVGGLSYSVSFAPTTNSTSPGLVTISPASGTTSGTNPTTLTIGLSQTVLSALATGTYSGTITASSPSAASATLSVTVTVVPVQPTAVTSVANAASGLAGAVSPGEIISIFGTNIGPATAAGLTLTSAGKVSTMLGNTSVFFDGTAAPLIYVSATQINAIVPYEINGRTQTTLTVMSNSITSSGVTIPVTTSSPGIFTTTQNGTGQAAALNQDGTVNSASNPAARGSVIAIYATGEGSLNPSAATGSVTASTPPFPAPVGKVTLTLTSSNPAITMSPGSVPATLDYAGEAPALVSGVLQVNAIIPTSIPAGVATIVLTVGSNSSPANVTVQVK